jgi:hypothetical protein
MISTASGMVPTSMSAKNSALATFSFGIDSFSNDELVVTISGSSLLSSAAPASVPALFFFADTDGVSDFLTLAPLVAT